MVNDDEDKAGANKEDEGVLLLVGFDKVETLEDVEDEEG